ncbi:hypothetical protein M9H77_36305 [Catharanthus roseus]|uniref:Uncharacterized protein n=1 Tax=Catharanthus roseus TaxID=4058 RepID=A0ACB9ZRT0_CATRO|nr:hypothetical protein M9H77_36305 [Catharanthus roseus]
MAPKKAVAFSSKSKRACVEGTSSDPTPNLFSFPEHLLQQPVNGGLGWVPLLHISNEYYPNLLREFYANMTHKTNKDLQTIISTVKGVRIILDRERLTSILRILDNGNTVTMDSNRKTINEDPDCNFDVAWGRLSEVCILDIYMLEKLHNKSPFSLSSLIIHTMRNTRFDTTKKRNKVWIPTSEKDRLRDRNPFDFRSIKKTTQTGMGASSSQLLEDDDNEADESYNPSDDKDYEADAQTTVSIDTFQAEIRDP